MGRVLLGCYLVFPNLAMLYRVLPSFFFPHFYWILFGVLYSPPLDGAAGVHGRQMIESAPMIGAPQSTTRSSSGYWTAALGPIAAGLYCIIDNAASLWIFLSSFLCCFFFILSFFHWFFVFFSLSLSRLMAAGRNGLFFLNPRTKKKKQTKTKKIRNRAGQKKKRKEKKENSTDRKRKKERKKEWERDREKGRKKMSQRLLIRWVRALRPHSSHNFLSNVTWIIPEFYRVLPSFTEFF